jgi:predicted ester cyclase
MGIDENKAVIERIIAAHNRQDALGVVANYAPNIANHGRPLGRSGMAEIYQNLYAAFPDFHFELQLIFGQDDWVTAQVLMSGTHLGTPKLPVFGGLLHGVAPTGKRVVVENIHLYRVQHGLVGEHHAVRDDLGMMQQLGLLPSVSHPAGDVSRPAYG